MRSAERKKGDCLPRLSPLVSTVTVSSDVWDGDGPNKRGNVSRISRDREVIRVGAVLFKFLICGRPVLPLR